ncbi:MAG: LCP family protein [Oscillospiraceae bacterium]|jgi:LCP family protein required for cell wall assembly|nr:LCP family protein [Oscillospiraceae bacterium]
MQNSPKGNKESNNFESANKTEKAFYNLKKNPKKSFLSYVFCHFRIPKITAKVVAFIALFVLSIIFIFFVCSVLYINKALDSVNYKKTAVSTVAKNSKCNTKWKRKKNTQVADEVSKNSKGLYFDNKISNFLVFGLDKHDQSENGRSDSILLLSVDNRHKKIKITSFLRDTLLEIPGHEAEKFNHAHAYGGAELAIETFEKNFKVKVNKHCEFDFEGFEEVIACVDGITIKLDADECDYINKFSGSSKKLEISNGEKFLDPKQTLCHVRNRNCIDSDIGRTARQREVIKAVINRFRSANFVNTISMIFKALPKITTNFSKEEILKLVSSIPTYLCYEIAEYRLPKSDEYTSVTKNGMSVLAIDNLDVTRRNFLEFLFESPNITN